MAPFEQKTEICFSQISLESFIRRMAEVLNFGIFFFSCYVNMADKSGIK